MDQYNTDELPSTAMGVMRQLPSTAAQVAKFAHQLIKAVKSGDANALEVQIMLRAVQAMAKEVIEEIEDNVTTAAEKYSERKFNAFGAIVEKADFGKYNYASSCDPEWEQLDAEFKTIERKRKEREEFLRALKEPMTAVNRETGEVYEIRPPFKNSKEGVKIYLANVK